MSLPRSLLLLIALSSAAFGAPQLPFDTPPQQSPIMSQGVWRRSVDACPELAPRTTRPTTVWDLRPDDFELTMALGDSISAGWFLGGIRETADLTAYEYRGSSWAAGGDEGQVTVPNVRFIHPYRDSTESRLNFASLSADEALQLQPDWLLIWRASARDLLGCVRSSCPFPPHPADMLRPPFPSPSLLRRLSVSGRTRPVESSSRPTQRRPLRLARVQPRPPGARLPRARGVCAPADAEEEVGKKRRVGVLEHAHRVERHLFGLLFE